MKLTPEQKELLQGMVDQWDGSSSASPDEAWRIIRDLGLSDREPKIKFNKFLKRMEKLFGTDLSKEMADL